MKKGITFGAFDLFHAGHVLMLQEAKTVCDYLIVCIQTDPSIDRKSKNTPVQSLIEREIIGDEYRDKEFTGRDQYLDKCYFNKRPHTFSSSELRERVADKENKKN